MDHQEEADGQRPRRLEQAFGAQDFNTEKSFAVDEQELGRKGPQ